MTKLCARGKSAAKRKFKVYPSAYANAYASKICAGKAKDPSGVKRKDWGPKKMLLGGLLTKGIKYGYKQYRKAGGRNIIEIMKSGVRGAGKKPRTAAERARRRSFKARHRKNIARGKMSAAYWANKVKW